MLRTHVVDTLGRPVGDPHTDGGGGEVLLDDSRLLAERGRAAGADVTLHIDPDGLHMGQLWSPWWPTAVQSLARAGRLAKECLP